MLVEHVLELLLVRIVIYPDLDRGIQHREEELLDLLVLLEPGFRTRRLLELDVPDRGPPLGDHTHENLLGRSMGVHRSDRGRYPDSDRKLPLASPAGPHERFLRQLDRRLSRDEL